MQGHAFALYEGPASVLATDHTDQHGFILRFAQK